MLQVGHDRLADAGEARLVGLRLVLLLAVKAQLGGVGGDVPRAHVGRHDDDGVLEVHAATLGVGDNAVLQDLQQDVPHILVCLLDLVEQHHGVGLTAHLLGQLAALLVTHIAGRRTDQARDGVLLHVLGHVDTHHGVLVTEHGLSQRLAQLGLAHARGTQEQEGADGPLGVLQTHTAAADGLGHRVDGLVLPHHTLVELLLQLQQAHGLILGEPGDGDARPAGHHLGDVVGGDGAPVLGQALPPVLPLDVHLLLIVLLDVTQLRGLLEVLSGDGVVLLTVQGADLLLQRLQVGGGALGGHAHLRRGLVHQVDGLVRQEPVADVPLGQLHGSVQRLVGDGQLVVRLIPVAQTLQDLQRGLRRGLAHGDGLEPALQRRVLLDVLAVLVQGGGADDADLAAAQSGLEDVGGVHSALGGACAHDGVQLVDEQDHVAVLLHLVQGVLDALLELAAVLGAGHHAAQVKGQDALVQQLLGHVAGGDALGQTLGDGGLAYARLTDEHGVVLAAAGEDLDDPLDLLIPPDDGIQLAGAGGLGQVAGVLGQRLVLLVRLAAGRGGTGGNGAGQVAHALHHGAVHLVGIDAHGAQNAQTHVAALPQNAHQQMGGADGAAAHAGSLGHSQLHHALGAGRKTLTGRGAGHALAHAALQHGADHLIGHAELGQHAVRHAVLLADQTQQQMLGAHVAVTQLLRRFLTQSQSFLCTGGEFILRHKGTLPFDLLCSAAQPLRGLAVQGLQLVPQAGGILVPLLLHGVVELRLQRVALALQRQRHGLVMGQQVVLGGAFGVGALRLLQHVHRLGELRQHPAAKAAEERLQHTERTVEPVIVEPAAHAAGHGTGIAHGAGTVGAEVRLGHSAVDIALIVERSLVLTAAITFHNHNLLAPPSDGMDQNLFEYIGAQRVAAIRRRRLQGSCAGGGQQRLSQLVADSLGLHQVLHHGAGAGRVQTAADGVDDVHQQRLPIHLHAGDADVTAAAPPGLHDVAVLRREPGGHDVVDLAGHAVEPLRQIAALQLQRTARLI